MGHGILLPISTPSTFHRRRLNFFNFVIDLLTEPKMG